MKLTYKLPIIVIGISLLFFSCTKNNGPSATGGIATMNVINTVKGSSQLIANINNQLLSYITASNNGIRVSYKGSFAYSLRSGNSSISVRDIADTTHEVYANGALNFSDKSVHSLFLIGTTSNSESVLTNDTLPTYIPASHGGVDSITGIRFINLSPGSNPVGVNIAGNANGSEINSLSYKSISSFKAYSANSVVLANGGYIFEFRDEVSGNILVTYKTAAPVFRNFTIVLYGEPGNEAAMSVNSF